MSVLSIAVCNQMPVLSTTVHIIHCLEEDMLPEMPGFVIPLLAHCESDKDVLDVSQLINQLCHKHKERACAAVDAAMLPFPRKVLAIQAGPGWAITKPHPRRT